LTSSAADVGIAQCLAYRQQGFVDQGFGDLAEGVLIQRQVDGMAIGQQGRDAGVAVFGQCFLGFAGAGQQQTGVLGRQAVQVGLLQNPAIHAVVEVVAAQGRVAAGGQHFKHATGELEDGNVESATAQVVHHISAFRAVIQAVGNGGGGGFVQQAQYGKTGQTRGVLGGLALGVVKIGRNGNHRAGQLATQTGFGTLGERTQDVGETSTGLFTRRRYAVAPCRGVDKTVGQAAGVLDVGQAAAHEAFYRGDGIVRVMVLLALGIVTHGDRAVVLVTHHGGQQAATELIGQHGGRTTPYRGHQRVGGTKVYPDSKSMLVWGGGQAGFGDL
jgi:hypothetical protein